MCRHWTTLVLLLVLAASSVSSYEPTTTDDTLRRTLVERDSMCLPLDTRTRTVRISASCDAPCTVFAQPCDAFLRTGFAPPPGDQWPGTTTLDTTVHRSSADVDMDGATCVCVLGTANRTTGLLYLTSWMDTSVEQACGERTNALLASSIVSASISIMLCVTIMVVCGVKTCAEKRQSCRKTVDVTVETEI